MAKQYNTIQLRWILESMQGMMSETTHNIERVINLLKIDEDETTQDLNEILNEYDEHFERMQEFAEYIQAYADEAEGLLKV